MLWNRDSDPADYARQFMVPFLRGYAQENKLLPEWLNEIPYFLKLREIDLYAQIKHQSPNWQENAWDARYMTGREEKIVAGAPYIPFDFESLDYVL
jgi:Ser/Thr protein kinase RdoA (MazF antagonist)